MDYDNIENFNEDQILDLYTDIVEGAGDGELISACTAGNRCVGGWMCYMYCDSNGSQRVGVCGSQRCK